MFTNENLDHNLTLDLWHMHTSSLSYCDNTLAFPYVLHIRFNSLRSKPEVVGVHGVSNIQSWFMKRSCCHTV